VTGSAIAIPLLAASGASAADGGSTWDRVAQCETGGAWSQNSGDGHYGGLQLSQDDWDKYGGLDFATRPDLASRNQQIAVAQKVLADQGVGAFHTCGLTTGLSKDSDSADIDTGVLGGGSDSSDSGDSGSSFGLSNSSGNSSSDSSDGSSSSDSSGGSLLDSSSSPSASASTDKTDNSAESTASASPSGSPSHRAPNASQGNDSSPTERAKTDDSDNSQQSAGSWSLVDTGALGSGRHRGASADETETDGHAAGTYTVRAGDTLASIADSRDVSGGWRALYDANKKAIGSDPNQISAGQTLRLGSE
jgi:hypothetical protein